MVEVQMVSRMARRAVVVAPVAVAIFWLWGGPVWGVSCGIGFAMTLGNLWLAARIIGAVAESSPRLLLPAGMVAFGLGLAVLTATAFGLQRLDFAYFPVAGFTLIGAHLGLVLWEAATGAYRTQPIDRRSALPTKELSGWN